MKRKRRVLITFLLCFTWTMLVNAQETISAAGGNASGIAGSVSYTVGQIIYSTISGTNGIITQGVQQPYEISVVTAIKNTMDINLECIVYPNPTNHDIKLIIRIQDFENLRFQLFDINGTPLKDKKIDGVETEISLDNLIPSIYFLKVLSGRNELKTFKIIKN